MYEIADNIFIIFIVSCGFNDIKNKKTKHAYTVRGKQLFHLTTNGGCGYGGCSVDEILKYLSTDIAQRLQRQYHDKIIFILNK
jgi:hypothetical protein